MDVGKMLTMLLFVMVAIVAIIVFISISGRFLPNECKSEIGGLRQHVLGALSNCAQKCWSKHDFGQDIYNDDCYVVTVSSKSEISKNEMESFLGGKIPTRVYFDKISNGTDLRVKVKYNVTGPEISLSLFCQIIEQPFDDLVSCQGRSVVSSIRDKVIFIGDSTPLFECCNEKTKNFERLMINTAKYLGGTRILIIYEDSGADPNGKQRLIESLNNEGFDVRFFLHRVQFKSSDIGGYDQVWLFRPGICMNPAMKEICSYDWDESEFDIIEDYLLTGKMVIVTDYPSIIPISVTKRIVEYVDGNITVSDACHCGCGPDIVGADLIAQHPITEGIKTYLIDAAAVIEQKCV